MRSSAAAITLTLAMMGAGPSGQPDVFGPAACAPADATLFVHVSDAGGIVRDLDNRPLARVGRRVVQQGQIGRAWQHLAQRTGLDDADLVSHLIGGDLTLVGRTRGQVREWTVITELTPDQAAALLDRLKARAITNRGGMPVYEATGQRLLLAKRAGTLVVGSADAPELFEEVLPRLARDTSDSLLESDDLRAARARVPDDGRVGVFIRHEPPLGGWTAAVLRPKGSQLAIRVASEFENTPFTRPRTEIEWDPSPLAAFEDYALVAIGEPTDVGVSRIDIAVEQVVGRRLVDDDLGRHVGARRFMAVAEQEMRLAARPEDLLGPTFGLCVEVTDRRAASIELDRAMARFVRHLNEFGHDLFSIDPPADLRRGPRRVNLAPAADVIFAETPFFGEMSLNWTVAETPNGTFCIIASHPQHMTEILRALREAPPEALNAPRRKLDSVGAFNGVRLARMLQSWSVQAGALAQPGQEAELREGLDLLASFAGGVERCCWWLERPTETGIQMNLLVRLSPPESSRPE